MNGHAAVIAQQSVQDDCSGLSGATWHPTKTLSLGRRHVQAAHHIMAAAAKCLA